MTERFDFVDKAIGAFANGDRAKARELVHRALEDDPENQGALDLLWRIEVEADDGPELGEFSESERRLERVRSEVESLLGQRRVEDASWVLGNWAGALQEVDADGLERRIRQEEIRLERIDSAVEKVDAQLSLGKFEVAERLLEGLRDLDPHHPEVDRLASELESRQEDEETEFARLVTTSALEETISNFSDEGRFESAIEAHARLAKVDPERQDLDEVGRSLESKRQALQELVVDLEDALGAGDYDSAQHSMQQASDLVPRWFFRPQYEERLKQIEPEANSLLDETAGVGYPEVFVDTDPTSPPPTLPPPPAAVAVERPLEPTWAKFEPEPDSQAPTRVLEVPDGGQAVAQARPELVGEEASIDSREISSAAERGIERRLWVLAAVISLFIVLGLLRWNPSHRALTLVHRTQAKDISRYHPVTVRPQPTVELGCPESDERCARDEKPQLFVKKMRPFSIARSETTWNQYRECADRGVCEQVQQPDGVGQDYPVTGVDWLQADAFCLWAGGRLPSELEWEVAATAQVVGPRPGGGGTANVGSSVCCSPAGQDGWDGTNPVEKSEANELGIRGLLGNVTEWTSSTYRPVLGAEDGSRDEGLMSVRGGSWLQPPSAARPQARQALARDIRSGIVGFRCAWDVPADGSAVPQ